MRALPNLQNAQARRQIAFELVSRQIHSQHFRRIIKLSFSHGAESFVLLQPIDPCVHQSASLLDEQRRKLAIAIIRKMTTSFVQLNATQMRAEYRLIATAKQFLPQKIFQQHANSCALGQPQTQALTHFGTDLKKPQFLPQDSMIAASSFFQLIEVRLLILRAEPRCAIQPLKLLSFCISFPIGTRHRQQLERLHLARIRNVWTAAQVHELTLSIKSELIVRGQSRLDVFDFQRLLKVSAEFNGFVAVKRKLLKRLGLFDDRSHLFFDGRKVLFAQFMLQFKIIIKTVINRWPESE